MIHACINPLVISYIPHIPSVNLGHRCNTVHGLDLWNETSMSYQTIPERSLMGFRLGVFERLILDKDRQAPCLPQGVFILELYRAPVA